MAMETVYLEYFVDFDSANQKLSMMAYIRIHWVDEQMVWKPRNYAGRSGLRLNYGRQTLFYTGYNILYYIILYYIILYYIILYYIILYYIILRLCNNILHVL